MNKLHDDEEQRTDIRLERELRDLWHFVEAVDAWAASGDHNAGPLLDKVIEARVALEKWRERG